MKVIGNIVWFILTGLWTGLCYCFLGVLWCITIIGIPFGKQCFKLARIAFFPFGKTIDLSFGKHPFGNIIWMSFGGLELASSYFVIGAIWCITIIGIPFGKQCFKLGKAAFAPFGAEII